MSNNTSTNGTPSQDSEDPNHQSERDALPPHFSPNPAVTAASGDPAFPLAGLPENTELVKLRAENHQDRRGMRKLLFWFIVGSSAIFLFIGAGMSLYVTWDMIHTKQDVNKAMIDVVKNSSPESISKFVFETRPSPPESLFHARETAREISSLAAEQRNSLIEKFFETTNWLSVSPMITLIAFILGVGLTLAIALMRALFKEEEAEEKGNALSQISTPLSKLFEYLIEFLKSKFQK